MLLSFSLSIFCDFYIFYFYISSEALEFAPTALKPETRYEKMADAFGGKGIFVKNHEELEKACQEIFKNPNTTHIVNVMIDPTGNKKPQEHSWLTKSKI